MTSDAPIVLRTNDLKWAFPQKRGGYLPVLDGLSLSFSKGRLYAILGPSGCGKSTLLRVLAGADKYKGDAVERNHSLLERTAFIEQDTALLPWRTAFQNACLGAELRGELNDTTVQKIRDDFDLFSLRGFEDHYPDQLSGGMQQRVAIIRALQSRPDVLFCDEPFSAIDFVSRLKLSTEFKKRCRLRSRTTIFVTHNIEEAIFLADEVIILSRRPCRYLKTVLPKLSLYPDDAVKCRQSPEFGQHFDEIWQALS